MCSPRALTTRSPWLPCPSAALRQLGPAQADDLYELVSERQGRSLIITSNRAPSDWYPLFPNPVVAESLLDRLINTSHQAIMNGPSYRPNKRPKTPPASPASPLSNDTDETRGWGITRTTSSSRMRFGRDRHLRNHHLRSSAAGL
ncbi:ATP-binding protein [Streptomyces sp. NPDC000888]